MVEFEDLPVLVLEKIYSYLDWNDLLSLGLVSKKVNNSVKNIVYRTLYILSENNSSFTQNFYFRVGKTAITFREDLKWESILAWSKRELEVSTPFRRTVTGFAPMVKKLVFEYIGSKFPEEFYLKTFLSSFAEIEILKLSISWLNQTRSITLEFPCLIVLFLGQSYVADDRKIRFRCPKLEKLMGFFSDPLFVICNFSSIKFADNYFEFDPLCFSQMVNLEKLVFRDNFGFQLNSILGLKKLKVIHYKPSPTDFQNTSVMREVIDDLLVWRDLTKTYSIRLDGAVEICPVIGVVLVDGKEIKDPADLYDYV